MIGFYSTYLKSFGFCSNILGYIENNPYFYVLGRCSPKSLVLEGWFKPTAILGDGEKKKTKNLDLVGRS